MLYYCRYGQLGNGQNTAVLSPPSTDAYTGVSVLAAYAYHVCVVIGTPSTTANPTRTLSPGDLICWGRNDRGQLGACPNATDATTCSNCVEAWWPAGTSAARCTKCAAGYATTTLANNITIVCSLCPAGSAAMSGMTSCQPCVAGTYANLAGFAVCLPCPAGTFALGNGTVTCTPCAAGR